MLAAFDSGANQGWAVFDKQTCQLVACGFGQLPARFVPGPLRPGVTHALIERPHVHGKKARKKDIITLAIRAGETGGPLRVAGVHVHYVEPGEWKRGSTSKEIDHPRIWDALSPAEQTIVSVSCGKLALGKQHNVMDAIGIGLFGVGRK